MQNKSPYLINGKDMRASHGGKRPGSGRPKSPNAKVATAIRVKPSVLAYIKKLGGGSPSKGIELLAEARENSKS